jgi:hypothetical protein
VQLSSTVDGAQTLSVVTGGITRFGGAVGGTTALTSVSTDPNGTTELNGGSVRTTQTQTYGDTVTLGADTTLTSEGTGAAGNIAFGGTVDGGFGLTINTQGTGSFAKAVGGAAALASLTTDVGGTTALNGGAVTTTGAQSYGDAVVLGAATVLTSSGGGAVSFATTLDGAQTLAVDTAGQTTFGGAVGGTTALVSVTTDAPGTTAINGGAVTTTGAQSYFDAVTLGADTRVRSTGGGTLRFGQTIDGAHILSASTTGAVALDGVVGGTTALTGLALRAGSVTSVAGNRVGTLAADVAGGLTFDNAAALTVGTVDGLSGINTGSAATTLTVGGLLTVAGSIGAGTTSLTATGITQNAGTTINAGASTVLLDANDGAVNLLGTITTTNGGVAAVTIRDAGTVALGTIVTGGAGTLTLGGAGGDQLSGAVTQNAGTTISTGTLTGTIGGTATLTNAGNAFATLGAISTNGLALRDGSAGLAVVGPVNAGGGNLALTLDSGTLALQGNLVATTGTVTLTSTAGPITQTAGTINAATLTGSAVGGITLTAAGNSIATLAGLTNTGGGGISLVDSRALTITSDVSGGTGDLSLNAQGIDFAGRTISTGGNLTLTGNAGAITGATATAGGGFTATAGSLNITTATATGGALALTTTAGNLTVGTGKAGTDATFDANGTAALGAVTAGAANTITVKAADAQITGVQSASKVTFVNRTPASITVKLGNGTSTGGFTLDQTELNFVEAGTLTIDGGTGNVEFGTLALDADAGRTNVTVLSTGRIDVLGAVSSTGSTAGRTIRLGGTATGDADQADVIQVVASPDAGGRLLFEGANLELRGRRIGVGQSAGFLDTIGFDEATGQPVAQVESLYVGNANSSLYNSTFGGSPYTPTGVTLVSANTLTVRYTDYALFQNTGAPGLNFGVSLGGSVATPTSSALVIQSSGTSNNAFALFGSINGISGTATAVLGSQVISFNNINIAASRVNGCLIGSGAGCLSSVVSQPVLNVFDASRLDVFRSADDLALPFDPVIGTSNEALFSGFTLLDVPLSGTQCTADAADPSCKQNQVEGK